jgi:hypothetical protein
MFYISRTIVQRMERTSAKWPAMAAAAAIAGLTR